MATGMRDIVVQLSPPWLADQDEPEGKVMYTLALVQDELVTRGIDAIELRLPTRANVTALPYLGSDRLIPQGPDEPDATYALRLTRFLDLWRLAAGNAGVLQQVLGYLDTYAPRARIVTNSSRWASVAPDTDITLPPAFRLTADSQVWNWDADLSSWWRWWMILYSTSTSGATWAGNDGTWGDGQVWGDPDGSWGLGQKSTVFDTMRGIITLCKRAGSWCRWIVVSLDDDWFDPTVDLPDGTWANYGKLSGGVYVRARTANARYVWGVL